MTKILRITTQQSAYFQICLKYLSDVFSVNYTVLCLNSCQDTSVVFVKAEKWKSALHKGKSFGTLFTDMPRAFDCFSHKLPNFMPMDLALQH